MTARAFPAPNIASELLSLTKPRLSALVLCTTAGGMWLAMHLQEEGGDIVVSARGDALANMTPPEVDESEYR